MANNTLIEDLIFSKAHNIWATAVEFPHLHRILNKSNHSNPQTTNSTATSPTTSAPPVTNPSQVSNNSRQQWARNAVAKLLRYEPRNGFFISLSKWNKDYTEKQLEAIKRSMRNLT
jgi:hypothetical protein